MLPEFALSAVLHDTTLDALRAGKTHDAIIVGGGAAGGWAAMLLAESGARSRARCRAATCTVPDLSAENYRTRRSKSFDARKFELFASRTCSTCEKSAENTWPMASANSIALHDLGVVPACIRGRPRLSICHGASSSLRLDSQPDIGRPPCTSRPRPTVLSFGSRRFRPVRWTEPSLAARTQRVGSVVRFGRASAGNLGYA
jgi:hypothetical protein